MTKKEKKNTVVVLLEAIGFFTEGNVQKADNRSVRNVKPGKYVDRFYFADKAPNGHLVDESKLYFIGKVLGEKAVKSTFNDASRRKDVLRALKRSPDKKVVLTKLGNVIDLHRDHNIVVDVNMKRLWPKPATGKIV